MAGRYSKSMIRDLANLGIDATVEYIEDGEYWYQRWYIIFKTKEDMTLYKLIGQWRESSQCIFKVKEDDARV